MLREGNVLEYVWLRLAEDGFWDREEPGSQVKPEATAQHISTWAWGHCRGVRTAPTALSYSFPSCADWSPVCDFCAPSPASRFETRRSVHTVRAGLIPGLLSLGSWVWVRVQGRHRVTKFLFLFSSPQTPSLPNQPKGSPGFRASLYLDVGLLPREPPAHTGFGTVPWCTSPAPGMARGSHPG